MITYFDHNEPNITYTLDQIRQLPAEALVDAEFPDGIVAHFTARMLV